jgi:hypothetical protein
MLAYNIMSKLLNLQNNYDKLLFCCLPFHLSWCIYSYHLKLYWFTMISIIWLFCSINYWRNPIDNTSYRKNIDCLLTLVIYICIIYLAINIKVEPCLIISILLYNIILIIMSYKANLQELWCILHLMNACIAFFILYKYKRLTK